MKTTQSVGAAGESAAADYLTAKKYQIIERNHLRAWGEFDIVALAPDRTLVFIEVKTIYTDLTCKSNNYITPEDNMTATKIRKTKRAAEAYANTHPTLVGERGWRIDMIAVDLCGEENHIRHYENI